MLDKMNNNSIIPPPPHLLEIYSTSTASHWQKRTSLYAFASEFRRCRNSLLFNTSGIRAAVANPQRIKDTPAVNLCLRLVSVPSISKSFFSQYTAHLRCRIAKSVHPCTLLAASFGGAETSLLFNTSGIRAAAENPRRIRSGMDAAGSKLQQVFRQKNLSLYSVHGRTLYNMPAGVFYTLLASASSISKRLFLQYTAHILRCCSQINPHRIKISINGCKNINSG